MQVFSRCQDVAPDLEGELGVSMQVLGVGGVRKEGLRLADYPNKELAAYSGEIRCLMESLESEFEPSSVFVPCSEDRHQDHRVVFEEAVRAFKYATILGYVQPWNCLREPYTMYIPLTRQAINKKVRALKCYGSQSSKTYMQREYVEGLARHLGWKIGRPFAEGFEVVRMVVGE